MPQRVMIIVGYVSSAHSIAAFLPSSFAMYATTLAFAFSLEPPSTKSSARTLWVTLLFATGAIVGWPFALALSLPFVFEELFVLGADRVDPAVRGNWMVARWRRLIAAALVAALIFASVISQSVKPTLMPLQKQIPVISIDSVAYQRWTIVPWNIVRYNIFGGSERGPDLYGTSPWHFYILNLLLNFNILFVLAFASVPALAITYYIDRKRLGLKKPGPDQSSPFTLLALRLAPLYLWTAILTAQAHKEERFMFPAYPLICFNAAVTVYLLRGWIEVAYVSIKKSPFRVGRLVSSLASPGSSHCQRCLAMIIGLQVNHLQHGNSFHHSHFGADLNFPHPRVMALLSRTPLYLQSFRGI
jgi:alpha-1,2-mannosyltransferase